MNSTIEEELQKHGKHLDIVVGNSMQPLLRVRQDQVVLTKLEKPLKKYDVVLYKRPNGQYVLHRIVKIKKDHYIINGDNRYHLEIVPKDWVIALMEGFYRCDKYYTRNSLPYRLYITLWCRPLTIRRLLLYLRQKLKQKRKNR